jgi:hypothetical protein
MQDECLVSAKILSWPERVEKEKPFTAKPRRAQRKTKNRVFRTILLMNLLNHRNHTTEKNSAPRPPNNPSGSHKECKVSNPPDIGRAGLLTISSSLLLNY